MKKSNFLNAISDGIIESNFYFEVSDYVFTVHNSKLSDAYYNPPIIEIGLVNLLNTENNNNGDVI